MNEEEHLRKETEKQLNALQKEKLIDGAIEVFGQTSDSKIIFSSNSRVQFAGDSVFIQLKDESYTTYAIYRHRNGEYEKL